MANHLRRTTTGWVADFTIDGKRKQYRAPTRKAAADRMAKAIAEADQPNTTNTFALKDARLLSLRVRWRGMACETTAAGYSLDVVSFYGENYSLGRINAREVERYRDHLRLKGQSAATINWKVSTLQSMLKDAVLHGHLDVMPALPKRLKMNNTKQRTLSPIEVDTFAKVFEAFGHPDAAALLVLLVETGLRWGEAENMRRCHVDQERWTLLVPKTKNGQPRTVPLTRRAQQALEGRLEGVPTHRVWPYSYKQFQHLWDRAKAAMGLAEDQTLTIHCCRHTCASRLASSGIPLHQIQAWGGWRSLAAVSRYMHIDVSGLETARQALEHG